MSWGDLLTMGEGELAAIGAFGVAALQAAGLIVGWLLFSKLLGWALGNGIIFARQALARRRRQKVPRYVISEAGMSAEEIRARRQRFIQRPDRSVRLGGIDPEP